MMRKYAFQTVFGAVLILAGVIAACAPQQAAPTSTPPPPTDVAAIIRDYSTWTSLYASPRNVSTSLMLLCRLATEAEIAVSESEHGNGLWLNVYVNPAGAEAMRQREGRVFPAGSVIVKEKLVENESTEAHSFGMMVKHEAGFNPEGGDWEYIYQDENGIVTRGGEALAHCQACHMGEGSFDSVFGILEQST